MNTIKSHDLYIPMLGWESPRFSNKLKIQNSKKVHNSRKIATVRIHIERVIGSINNRFGILWGVILLRTVVASSDKTMTVCAALRNLGGIIVYKVQSILLIFSLVYFHQYFWKTNKKNKAVINTTFFTWVQFHLKISHHHQGVFYSSMFFHKLIENAVFHPFWINVQNKFYAFIFFLSTWVFFHRHSGFTGKQGKKEVISLNLLCWFHPLTGI